MCPLMQSEFLRSPEARRENRSLTDPIAIKGWRGASGRRYTFTAYHLIGCPAPVAASYVFVRRDPQGKRVAVAIGYTDGDVASLNLAAIRHRGANLGADEVHLRPLASGAPHDEVVRVAFDLAAALCPSDAVSGAA